MITDPQQSLCVILYEGFGSKPVDAKIRWHVISTALDHGYEILASGDSSILDIDCNKYYLVLGCFASERPTINQHAGSDRSIYYESIVDCDAGQITQILETHRERIQIKKPGNWKPWFPTIDYERCTNCLQCLSFCLFDVYGRDPAGKVKVKNPANCKTDCPACSRVCPAVAIIFPKYPNSPINGDEVKDIDMQREKVKTDISSLLGGDIYKTLQERNARSKSRFSPERDENQALRERESRLKEFQEMLDIPDEVLQSLPGLKTIDTE